jgi:hypothetical protein
MDRLQSQNILTDSVTDNFCTGELSAKVFDRDNNLIDYWTEHNLVVNGARDIMCSVLSDRTTCLSKIGVGTGTAVPTVNDTTLTNMQTAVITNYDVSTQYEVGFNAVIGYTDMNSLQITEYGLLDNNDRLFSRKTRAVIEKTPYIRIELYWIIRFL